MVLAWQEPGLTPAQRLVLLSLADCSDLDGRNAFIGERSIAEHTRLAMRTVKLCIRNLRDKGLVATQELPTNRRSTTYRLLLPGGAKHAPHMGANDAPLGVISRVQPRVQKSHFPHTPYKEDPVDPVDPGVVSLLSKAVVADFASIDGVSLVESLTRWARARNLPHDIGTLSKAIDLARLPSAKVSA